MMDVIINWKMTVILGELRLMGRSSSMGTFLNNKGMIYTDPSIKLAISYTTCVDRSQILTVPAIKT